MEEHRFATVSEWMVHGHIMGYIRKNATNRLELVCISAFQVECFPHLTPTYSYMVREKV